MPVKKAPDSRRGWGVALLSLTLSLALPGAAPSARAEVAARPAPLHLPGACLAPPQRDYLVEVIYREANPPPDREEPTRRTERFTTRPGPDLDGDGVADVLVPQLSRFRCPHEVEYLLYVMRGACGHRVGSVLGFPVAEGPARAGALRDLRTQRRWAVLTDPMRPPSPHNVATLHEESTRYRARAGVYRAEPPRGRAGICHHCGIPSCRLLSGP